MIELLEAVHLERGIPLEILYESIEEGLTTAARLDRGSENAVVSIDRTSGSFTVFERRRVVERVTDPANEIADVAGYEPGDFFDVALDAKGFGRVAALTARQVVAKRVIEFERERVFSKYRNLEGTLVNALVQRVERGNVYVLLDADNEACLPRDHYRGPAPAINDRVRAVIDSVRKTPRGPAVLLSRASDRFVAAMLPTWDLRAIAQSATTALVVTRTPPGDERIRTELEALAAALGKDVRYCLWDPPPYLVATAIAALGGLDAWDLSQRIVREPDDVIIVPADAAVVDLSLVEQVTKLRILATDDVAAARAELQAERFAYHVETAPPSSTVGAVDPGILAELLRFKAERDCNLAD